MRKRIQNDKPDPTIYDIDLDTDQMMIDPFTFWADQYSLIHQFVNNVSLGLVCPHCYTREPGYTHEELPDVKEVNHPCPRCKKRYIARKAYTFRKGKRFPLVEVKKSKKGNG